MDNNGEATHHSEFSSLMFFMSAATGEVTWQGSDPNAHRRRRL
jgi:hypothetical protein